jgi:regulator of protease activity HflC (stomatin/prohibitin superfamily)
MDVVFLFFFFIIGIFLLVVAAKTIKIVPQSTVLLIERLGSFNRMASNGRAECTGQTCAPV